MSREESARNGFSVIVFLCCSRCFASRISKSFRVAVCIKSPLQRYPLNLWIIIANLQSCTLLSWLH